MPLCSIFLSKHYFLPSYFPQNQVRYCNHPLFQHSEPGYKSAYEDMKTHMYFFFFVPPQKQHLQRLLFVPDKFQELVPVIRLAKK